MNSAEVLIQQVEAAGGRIRLDGGRLLIAPPEAAESMMSKLKEYKMEIMDILKARVARELDAALPGEWLLENCIYGDCWWGGIGCLQLDLACWCANCGQPMLSSRRAFEAALLQEGFWVTSDSLVYGLVLKEDVLAHERFQQAERKCHNNTLARRESLGDKR